MKTIKELKDERLISTRLFNALRRGIYMYSHLGYDGFGRKDVTISFKEIHKLTIEDVLNLFTIEEISKWRGIGVGCIEELKGLL